MTQFIIALISFIFLILPPVSNFLESHMVLHMHMQMPLLVITGMLMNPFILKHFPLLFKKCNRNGLPGILLFIIIMTYWMIPRIMDEALSSTSVEFFKFISLPFLGGIPLRDSWDKISLTIKNVIILFFTILFIVMGWLYIKSPVQLCNNYLLIEQYTLGWGFLLTAFGMIVYLAYIFLIDPKKYE